MIVTVGLTKNNSFEDKICLRWLITTSGLGFSSHIFWNKHFISVDLENDCASTRILCQRAYILDELNWSIGRNNGSKCTCMIPYLVTHTFNNNLWPVVTKNYLHFRCLQIRRLLSCQVCETRGTRVIPMLLFSFFIIAMISVKPFWLPYPTH